MKNKIFEIVELSDGGPNDKGNVINYDIGKSEKELRQKHEIHHNFIQFRVISKETYIARKEIAEKEMLKFNLNIK